MLLIFNPDSRGIKDNSMFPLYGAINPSANIHFALEIEKEDYKYPKNMLVQKMKSKSKRNKHGETN
jgi:hypothetical protein